MQKILQCLRFWPVPELFANEVLDGFDVVVGGRLNFLHTLSVIDRKIINDVIQDVLHYRRERCQLRHSCLIGQTL